MDTYRPCRQVYLFPVQSNQQLPFIPLQRNLASTVGGWLAGRNTLMFGSSRKTPGSYH